MLSQTRCFYVFYLAIRQQSKDLKFTYFAVGNFIFLMKSYLLVSCSHAVQMHGDDINKLCLRNKILDYIRPPIPVIFNFVQHEKIIWLKFWKVKTSGTMKIEKE